VTQLAGDSGRHGDGAEQPWQHVDLADQDQVVKPTGVRDDDPRRHGSGGGERLQVCKIAPDILEGDGLMHAPYLEKAVELEAGLDAEHLAQLVGGELPGLVGGDGERLQDSRLLPL